MHGPRNQESVTYFPKRLETCTFIWTPMSIYGLWQRCHSLGCLDGPKVSRNCFRLAIRGSHALMIERILNMYIIPDPLIAQTSHQSQAAHNSTLSSVGATTEQSYHVCSAPTRFWTHPSGRDGRRRCDTRADIEHVFSSLIELMLFFERSVCIRDEKSIACTADTEEDPDRGVKEAFSEIRQVVTGQGDRAGARHHLNTS